MVNPLKWLSVGGSFIRGTGHAIADSEYTGIKAGENYAKKRWSAGGVVTTSTFNLRTEYLAGKDRSVKAKVSMQQAVYASPGISISSLRSIISTEQSC